MRRSMLALLLLLTVRLAAAGEAYTSSPTPWRHDWARGAVFYQILVRSFADSNGDGKGDLQGLISKLDYLNDGDPKSRTALGVDAIWLLPIFKSPSYHGYDVTDYESINPEYGSNADFERLCREAHKRGIRVIIDLVLNHTSEEHPWFREAVASPSSPRRDWYVWRSDDPGWTRPWSQDPTWHRRGGSYYYGLFWRGLPDLNFRNPRVREEAKRIAKFWLDRGADGFRLDAARYIVEGAEGEQADTPETHAFWAEFSGYVRSIRPDAVLVGEVWTSTEGIAPYFGDTSKVAGGDELPMNFDFPIGGAILASLRGGRAIEIFAQLRDMQRLYPRGVIDAPFLTNHDQNRIATELNGDPGRLRAAAAVLLTLPGAPFIYYGEELGLRNYGPGFGTRNPSNKDDEQKRTPMPWSDQRGGGFTTGEPWTKFSSGREALNVAAEAVAPGSLLSRYRALIALRHGSEALRSGELALLPPRGGALAFLRRSAGEAVLVVHNVGATSAAMGPLELPQGQLQPLFVDDGVGAPARGTGGWTFALPPFSTGVWKIAAPSAPGP